jgi:hypothetical protein
MQPSSLASKAFQLPRISSTRRKTESPDYAGDFRKTESPDYAGDFRKTESPDYAGDSTAPCFVGDALGAPQDTSPSHSGMQLTSLPPCARIADARAVFHANFD